MHRVDLPRGQYGEGDRQPPSHDAGVLNLPGRRQPGQTERASDLVGGEVRPPGPGAALGQGGHLGPGQPPGETVSADIAFGVAGQPSNSVLATYLDITPPGSHRHFVLRIPYGAALVYRASWT
jgi:hypothetical protein